MIFSPLRFSSQARRRNLPAAHTRGSFVPEGSGAAHSRISSAVLSTTQPPVRPGEEGWGPYSTAAERVEKPNLRCKKAKKRRNGVGEREPRSTPGKNESALENSMLKRGQPKKLSKSPLSVVSAALTARVHPLPYPGEPPWPPLHARTSISTSTPNAAVAGSQLTERSGTAVEDGRITRGMSSAANATTGQPPGNRHSCVPTFARRKSIRARSCTRGRRQPMAIAPQTIFPSLRQTGIDSPIGGETHR
jgi:hypothetical protein